MRKLENSGVLIDRGTETVNHGIEKQDSGFPELC